MTEEEQLERLLELQRKEAELLAETREFEDNSDDDDDHEYKGKRQLHLPRPTVPDMRFEKQFQRTVDTLKAQGASNTAIFFSAVIKDQVIMQLITGFTWCLAGHVWRWYRLRQHRVNNKESFVFLRGLRHGITRWVSSSYQALVNLPSLTLPSSPAP